MSSPTLRELEDISTEKLKAALKKLVKAQVTFKGIDLALAEVRQVLAQHLTLAELMGRADALSVVPREGGASGDEEEAGLEQFAEKRGEKKEGFFRRTLRALLKQEPRLAEPVRGEPMWQAVARRYAEERGSVFAMAKSLSLKLTARVRDLVTKAKREGQGVEEASETIAKMSGFTEAYAETVYRTNVNGAFHQGQIAQASEPNVAKVVGAFEFVAVRDSNVRPNHAAAHGFLAAQDDELWDGLTPPLGYNCRCTLRMVTKRELKRRKLLEAGSVVRVKPVNFHQAGADSPTFGRRQATP